jgi:hypothetical protein
MTAPKLQTLILSALAMGAIACGPSLSSDRDPSIPIPMGATYALAGGTNEGEERDANLQSPIVHQRIQVALNEQLQAKGFKLAADPATAAFTVRYFLGMKTSVSYSTTTTGVGYRTPYGYGWGWGGAMASTVPIESKEGGFVVDLLQTAGGKQAWRGMIKGDVPNKPPSQEQVDRAVKRVLDQLKP